MSVLSQPRFHEEAKAFEYLEGLIWADGKVCPHCGIVNGRMYDLAGVRSKPSKKNPEGAFHHKMKVLALVDRDSGKARAMVVDNVRAETLMPIVLANVAREARVMTNEHSGYRDMELHFAGHGTTSHGRGQYVDLADRTIHSNTVEGYFSIFKRGMKGVYQHCGEKHLHRYLAEYEFRYNNRVANGVDDRQRGDNALQGIVGKRLTYRRIDGEAAA